MDGWMMTYRHAAASEQPRRGEKTITCTRVEGDNKAEERQERRKEAWVCDLNLSSRPSSFVYSSTSIGSTYPYLSPSTTNPLTDGGSPDCLLACLRYSRSTAKETDAHCLSLPFKPNNTSIPLVFDLFCVLREPWSKKREGEGLAKTASLALRLHGRSDLFSSSFFSVCPFFFFFQETGRKAKRFDA
mmetsp:Transcript_30801/g.60654  ORF Transcript_30801/g.60654 Transcript_30801/m.60654 type:complete len:187 (-) Transcript_30801:772-1332(-)